MTNIPKISYLLTCKNEGYQLQSLIELLYKYKTDSECIILDDYTDDVDTLNVLNNVKRDGSGFFTVYQHQLNNNYSTHKNFGKSLCRGEWVWQIDADEMPSEVLLTNLHEILDSNPTVELFWVPRINNFIGVTDAHAKQWGWDINNPNKWVNWHGGDYQGRIFKNLPHLRWERPLHEKIEGYKVSSKFPKEEEFALIHTKTIEKQIQTNVRYNTDFSEAMNRGHKIP